MRTPITYCHSFKDSTDSQQEPLVPRNMFVNIVETLKEWSPVWEVQNDLTGATIRIVALTLQPFSLCNDGVRVRVLSYYSTTDIIGIRRLTPNCPAQLPMRFDVEGCTDRCGFLR